MPASAREQPRSDAMPFASPGNCRRILRSDQSGLPAGGGETGGGELPTLNFK